VTEAVARATGATANVARLGGAISRTLSRLAAVENPRAALGDWVSEDPRR
jgi:hypothetical protein